MRIIKRFVDPTTTVLIFDDFESIEQDFIPNATINTAACPRTSLGSKEFDVHDLDEDSLPLVRGVADRDTELFILGETRYFYGKSHAYLRNGIFQLGSVSASKVRLPPQSCGTRK